ncbi:MAG: response regulator transcription factor [Thermoguttaceae bacterium]|nr:response regulator transcription factor [Thermoguttaceae bacterium]
MSIRVLTADDHEVVRAGLRAMLAGSDIEVIGEAANGNQAVSATLALCPDLVLLDIRLPDDDGLSAMGRIRIERPKQPILVLSTYDNPTYIARAVALGPGGYLLKSCTRDELCSTIRRVASGENAWTREELRRVTGALAVPRFSSDVEVPLTQRESEVLRQLAHGLTNREIAQALHISYETVKEHVQHILRKVGVSDRTQAAVWAVRKQIV